MGDEHWVLYYHGTDRAQPTIPDPVSNLHHAMRDLWMGCVDETQFGNGSKLLVVGVY